MTIELINPPVRVNRAEYFYGKRRDVSHKTHKQKSYALLKISWEAYRQIKDNRLWIIFTCVLFFCVCTV